LELFGYLQSIIVIIGIYMENLNGEKPKQANKFELMEVSDWEVED
jgi:hypothetical protein